MCIWRTLLAMGALLCAIPLCGQSSPDPDTSSTNTAAPQSSNINPTRTVESHTHSGNRTVDSHSIERRNSDGDFEPYQDIETETVKVNSTTTRTVTRTFGRDSNGAKTLVQVNEEETRTSPDGGSSATRTVSNPDANGNLQVVQRQIEETKKIGKDVEETKTTTLLPGGGGELTPAMQTQERRQTDANGTIQSQKTTLLPDIDGKWQVGEVQRSTTQKQGNTGTTDQTTSRSDLDGSLDQVSKTVSTETKSADGDSRKIVETDSVDVPGSARDGGLHPVERKTTVQRTTSTGKQVTEQRVEKPDPGDPAVGLQTTTITVDTSSAGVNGTRGTRTVESRDADGKMGVVSVDTTDKQSSPAVQVQIAPTEKAK